MCKKCATIVQPVLSPVCLGVAWLWMDEGEKLNRGGEKVEELESRREKLEKLESRRGRGWKRRSAASTCQKVHRMGLGPPGSPLDEPINVNSGIGIIGKKGNMGQNPNLPNSQTWILT